MYMATILRRALIRSYKWAHLYGCTGALRRKSGLPFHPPTIVEMFYPKQQHKTSFCSANLTSNWTWHSVVKVSKVNIYLFINWLMGMSVFRPVQSTCAASPLLPSSWLLRPVKRTRWTQTTHHTHIPLLNISLQQRVHSTRTAQLSVCACLCVPVFVCVCAPVSVSACALTEGAGCL